METNKSSPFLLFVSVVILIALFGLIWKNFTLQQVPSYVLLNQNLPAFDIPTLSHSKSSLTENDLKGRVVLLNFWASWCSACEAEHAVLLKIKNEFHVPIYGIDYRDISANAVNWLKKTGDPYVVSGVDMNGATAAAFKILGTPQTYILDAQGVIRYIHIGALTEQTWLNEIWPLVQKLQKTP